MDVPLIGREPPIEVNTYPVPPDPPKTPEPKDPEPRQDSQINRVEPLVKTPVLPADPIIPQDKVDEPVFADPGPVGNGVQPADPIKEIVPPVRVEAQLTRTSELQPPYPASEQRSESEGKVSIRVRIGADGRVIAAQKVSATNDAFYRATERHALRAWRFKPATVDGKAVESSKVINVTFRLDD
jgi:periplasmic protein TonB